VRRLSALAGIVATVAGLTAVPAVPAAATAAIAEEVHRVHITGDGIVVDDEPRWDHIVRHRFDLATKLSPGRPSESFAHRGRAGEVTSYLALTVDDLPAQPGVVRATARLTVDDGEWRPDDYDPVVKSWDIPAGGAVTETIRARAGGPGEDDDRAEYKITVRNTVSRAEG
jgi:hypothetical protein